MAQSPRGAYGELPPSALDNLVFLFHVSLEVSDVVEKSWVNLQSLIRLLNDEFRYEVRKDRKHTVSLFL